MPENTLSVTDNRTGKVYVIPIEDGTVRAMALRQIKTDAEDFACQGAEASGDLDASLLQQVLPHLGVVDAFRYARGVERPQAVGGIRHVHPETHRLNARHERRVIAAMPLPAILAALFGHDREAFAQRIE